MNNSPWIHQLDKERPTISLAGDEKADVAVIGAGIAGLSTAFFLLKHTKAKKVVLIEGDKLAHGATGHNAGQITSFFEKPFREIVAEYGLEKASEGQRNMELAWELLDQMYTEAGLDIPLDRFTGYDVFSTKEQIIGQLEDDYLRRSGGLRTMAVEILEDVDFLEEIPGKYYKLFSIVPREDISFKLETFDSQYVAVSSSQKGVMNSALFCQEVANFLIERYPERFSLYEHTPVAKVVLKEDKVLLDAVNHTVECSQVVLCTNGFDNFDIISAAGLALDTRFHHSIHGLVAFMSGYLEKFTGLPAAMSYFQKRAPGLSDNPGELYFYVTRRQYEYEKQAKHNLVSVGGPDFALEEKAKYDRSLEFSESAKQQITDFIRRTYDKAQGLEYTFMWHGVMGYTRNLLRMIGPDPDHARLYYNLGCNGVGILPSIFGGDKVARQIAGETFPSSIFDVLARDEVKSPLKKTKAKTAALS